MSNRPVLNSVKVLRGNPGKRRLTQEETGPLKDMPKMPGWLGIKGKKFWKLHAKDFHERGHLTNTDQIAFAGLCETLGLLCDTNKILDEEGIIARSQRGVCKHPAYNIKKECLALVRTYAIEFGCTPSSRGKVPEASSTIDDEMDEFLKRAR